MSYLNYPRLIFSGTCIVDPSTVNNTPSNYGPTFDNPSQLWNPNGTGNFKFKCVVTQVVYLDGSIATTAEQDPVIGMALNTTDMPYPGKIADIDPQQQMVSTLWGLKVALGSSDSPTFQGNYAHAPFMNIFQKWTSGSGNPAYGAYYQSQLQNVTWTASNSKYLDELKSTTTNDALSIKFNLDSYQTDSSQSSFTSCQIVGSIGPVSSSDEPYLFPVGRCLRPNDSSLNYAICIVDEKNSSVTLDMGNSIPIQGMWEPSVNIGTLQLVAIDSVNGDIILGDIDYSYESNNTYNQTGYIQNFALSAEQLEIVQQTHLGIIDSTNNLLYQENTHGTYIRAQPFVYLMNADDTATVQLVATQFGKPMPNTTIFLSAYTDAFSPQPPIGHFGQPTAALPFPAQVTTDANGVATFTMTASDPGNPRKYLDGQLYGISYYINDANEEDPGNSGNFISVHVYQDTQFPDPVTWTNGMQDIFNQYGVIYPIMGGVASFINLKDYTSVYSNKDQILMALTLDINNPNHMPVTRDLSRSKLNAMVAWILADCPE